MSFKPINPPQEALVKVGVHEPLKRGRKRKIKKYFTDITEMAISAYNNIDDDALKNKIYNRFIHYPFYKLSEIVYNTGRYGYIDLPVEDIKHELIAHMIDKIHMYKPIKGKAFSYFNRMVKNWLIAANTTAYDKIKITFDLTAVDINRNIIVEETTNDMISDQHEFIELFITYIDTNLGTIFTTRRDISIADSIIYIFKTRHLIENYNKKALYVLVRERSRCDQQYVTKVVNTLKDIYNQMFVHFQKTGKLENNTFNKFF